MSIDPTNLGATAHVTFQDDFNTLSLWNGTAGVWSTTFWYDDPNGNGSTLSGNGEQEWYINANSAATRSVTPWTVNNGVLTLTAAPTAGAVQSAINNYTYTSGEVNTFHSFSQTYGYFEMKAQLPSGQGFWPAFWLLPESGAWPPELDVMEVLGNNTNVLYTTAHSAASGGHTQSGSAANVADMSAGYHTYGVDWEPDFITWYFDGSPVYHIATPADMNQPMYMIANLAVGGYWPGNADGSSTGELKIDYIRAYAAGADTSAAVAAAAAQPVSPSVSTAEAAYTLGAGVTTVTLTGSAQTVTGNNAGDTFYSNDTGNHLIGGTGNDTFYMGRANDTVTGGGGDDTFVFNENPWWAGHITDFGAGDTINLTPTLDRAGFHGADPVASGFVKITDDGAGDAQVWLDPNGSFGAVNGWWLATTLDGAPASSLHASGGLVTVGQGPTTAASAAISTADAGYVLGAGVTTVTLTGSAQTVTGNNAGDTFYSNDTGNHLIGGTGNDTFYMGRANDTVTGGGGNDTFVFNENPWWAGHITDFGAGDTINLTPTLNRAGFHGADPVAAGFVKLTNDSAGEAQIWIDPNGSFGAVNGWWLATTLDGVPASTLHIDHGWITH